jgi:hypothetical protein
MGGIGDGKSVLDIFTLLVIDGDRFRSSIVGYSGDNSMLSRASVSFNIKVRSALGILFISDFGKYLSFNILKNQLVMRVNCTQ